MKGLVSPAKHQRMAIVSDFSRKSWVSEIILSASNDAFTSQTKPSISEDAGPHQVSSDFDIESSNGRHLHKQSLAVDLSA